MNDSTVRALNRLLRKLERAERRRRRPRGFSTAPLIIGLGLTLGYQLLVRLVPRVWGSMLPGGWEQANTFRGWPGLVWALARTCHQNFAFVVAVIAATTTFALLWVKFLPPLRFLVWLVAVGVILLDAGIVYVTLRAALEVAGQGVVPLP